MKQIVSTIDGSKHLKSNCKYIEKNYYLIGDVNIENSGQCYLINGNYIIYTDDVIYDNEKKQYVIKNNSLILGIIKFNKGGKFDIGYFSSNNLYNVYLINNDKKYIVISYKLLIGNKFYRESISNGVFYNIKIIDSLDLIKKPKILNDEKREYDYECTRYIKKSKKLFDLLYKPKENFIINNYSKIVKDLSFGLEFETTSGRIPDRLLKLHGLIPLRDGSIEGLEYVTCPMSSHKGINNIIDICKILKDRVTYDNSCSIHLHIGNIPRTKGYLLALYKTLAFIQDDFFNLFPMYKRFNFGEKKDDYTKPLPVTTLLGKMNPKVTNENLDEEFDILFKFLSMGYNLKEFGGFDNIEHHPLNPRGNRKWNMESRYYFVNLIPIIFGNKQTVEFRIHTSTFNSTKLLYYLFLCSIIINFVKDNENNILSNFEFVTKQISLYNLIFEYISKIPNLINKNEIANDIRSYLINRKSHIYMENKEKKDPNEENIFVEEIIF